MLKNFAVIWLCILIVLLPGCSLLPMLGGQPVDLATFEAEITGIQLRLANINTAMRQADTDNDGKLTVTEGLAGAGGIIAAAITGTNILRNRARRQRGERVETHPIPPVV